MPKIQETLESIEIFDDTKSRRRVNTAPRTVANITAQEIENGVTLERLGELNVPVYRYKTQITVHGKLPDIDAQSRIMGYKAIVLNANGSVGIKYIAIDAKKKEYLYNCALRSRFNTSGDTLGRWYASVTSTGFTIGVTASDKEQCLALYRTFPKDLIVGSVNAFRGVYGEFYVVANVAAIPQDNLNKLSDILWGIRSPEHLQELEEVAKIARDEEIRKRAEAEKQREKDNVEKRNALLNELRASHKPHKLVFENGEQFLRVTVGIISEPKVIYVRFQKKGPRLCYANVHKTGPISDDDFKGTFHALDTRFKTQFLQECQRGELFEVCPETV